MGRLIFINSKNSKIPTPNRKIVDNTKLQHDEKNLLLTLFGCFNSSNQDNYATVAQSALQMVGLYCRADRLYIYAYDFEREIAYKTYQWCADGIKQPSGIQNYLWLKVIYPLVSEHQRGEAVYFPSVVGVDKNGELIIISNKQDVKSLASFPLNAGGQCLGFIGIDLVRESRSLNNREVFMLKALAEIVANTELRIKAGKECAEIKQKQVNLVENACDWIWETDQNGYFTYVNERAEKITGFTPEEMIGKTPFCFMGESEAKIVQHIFREAVSSAQPLDKLENSIKHKEGYDIYFETSGMPLFNEDGLLNGFCGISREVTAQVRSRQKMEYLSMHDRLTGLYNRAYFDEELKRLQNSREYPITIIYIDVNNMKAVNDALGHSKGDDLLKAAAQLLKKIFRSSEIVARVGGDEFVIVLVGADEKVGEKLLLRIRSKVALYNAEKKSIPLSFSVGMATAQNSDTSLMELINMADDLMYRDKIFNGKESHLKSTDLLLKSYFENSYLGLGHSQRLARICNDLGKKLTLETGQLKKLDLLVKAHNLGKAGISKKILLKQGSLSKEEQNIICLHPEKGYRIAVTSPELSSIADLILKHHERWDGKGYPLGLKGELIPIECRILAVADAYSAMTEGRVYKAACSGEKAIEELQRYGGTQFDPQVVKAFCSLYEEGAWVRQDRQQLK